MKRTSLAAVALLLSTTAYAAIPDTEPSGVVVEKDPYAVTATSAVDNAYAGGSGTLHNASYDSWSNNDWAAAEPVAYVEKASFDEASFDEAAADAEAAKMADDKLAAADSAYDADAVDKGGSVDMAETDAADEPVDEFAPVAEPTAMDVEPTPVETGVGGPYETAANDLNPRPAAQNYPACSPGPGDDRCIQLYEPGVRQQLASWSQPTGGFAGEADTQTAMGGPYEPVDSTSETERLNQESAAQSEAMLQNVQMASAAVPADAAVADESAVDTASVDEAAYGEGVAETASLEGDYAGDDYPVDDEDVIEV